MSRRTDAPAACRARPTLATVADEAGVSRQTVSNALNSPELLRPDTLARVQEAIERLGYSPNRAARSLRTRSSHLVGLRVDPAVEDSANALMDRFVHSLVESTREAGLPRAAVQRRRRRRRRHRRVRRAAAVRGRRRLRGHRHLPRQPARRLAGPARACRSSRSAGRGASPPPGTPGSTSTAGPAWCRPSTTSSSAATPGSPGWAGRRARSSARTGAAAGSTGCTTAACRRAGSPPAATTPWSSARRAAHALLDVTGRSGRPRSCAPATPSRWGCCGPSTSSGCAPGADVGGGRLRRLDRGPGRARRG